MGFLNFDSQYTSPLIKILVSNLLLSIFNLPNLLRQFGAIIVANENLSISSAIQP